MKKWMIQWRMTYNGVTTQCRTFVEGRDIEEALDNFNEIAFPDEVAININTVAAMSPRRRMEAEAT